MDKAKEILKFQALLQMAASSGNDLGEEMRFQQGVLRSLELTDGDINNLIHDRHAREGCHCRMDTPQFFRLKFPQFER